MRRTSALVGALLLLTLVSVPQRAHAQEPPAPQLDVTTSFNTPAATIGDRLTLTVSVAHTADVIVTVIRPDILGTEVVGDAQPLSTLQVDGSMVTATAFEYQVFAIGEVPTGPIQVAWLLEDGTSGTIEVVGTALTIVPVRAEGDEVLRPLKPQATIPGAPPAWLLPAIGIALATALAGLLAVAVIRWRRGRAGGIDSPPVDVPEASARERLDTLRDLRLRDEEAFQRYYGTISIAVRSYLGDRFGFNASALTTSELERRMTAYGVDRWQARLVGGLLDRCDSAVYARRYPDPQSADHDLTVAFEIIELSRPRLALVEEESGVAS